MSKMYVLVAWLAVLFCCGYSFGGNRGLPLVCEEVDEIVVVEVRGSEHRRVVFLKGNSVLDTRLMIDEMLWTTDGPSVRLIWEDYWTAERIVDAKRLSVWLVNEDHTQDDQNGPWWAQNRNMRQLKQP